MGHRIDLVSWMGFPEEIKCPKCERKIQHRLREYDVDCGHPHVGKGKWEVDFWCEECDYEWTEAWKVEASFERFVNGH